MMKTKFYLLLISLLPFLVACDKDNPTPEPGKTNGRTVLVYMAADNTLKGLVDDDLSEMKTGWANDDYSTKEHHLLVYVDTGTSPRLVEIATINGEVKENLVKSYPTRNSCGTAEMQEVFNDVFGNKAYEAKSYGLVYWSHGDGWIPSTATKSTRWIGQDLSNGTNYTNIADFATVLKGAPHFDFILFDACFMHSVEVAYELRSYADYFIGSPTETPGPGAPYDKILRHMFQPGNAAQLVATYFAAYDELYDEGKQLSNSNWTGGVAIGAMKSSALEALVKATKSALSGIKADKEALRKKVFDNDQRNVRDASHVGYYDFVGMMEALVTDASKLSSWKSAYKDVSAYWATTPKVFSGYLYDIFPMQGANGITHYVPSAADTASDKAYRQTQWYKDAGLEAIGF